MDFRVIYDTQQENIPQIPEVDAAEKAISEIYKRVRGLDAGLADLLDTAHGALARAYEKQGFNGGLQLNP